MKPSSLWLIVSCLTAAACQSQTPAPPPAPVAVTTPRPATPAGPVVVIKTSMGEIAVELDEAKAPITVKNFLQYVGEKFYDGTLFHRVISAFMIQGGGFTPDMKEKPTHDPIKNESQNGLANTRGTIAMARLPSPDSATAQFFINVVDNQRLNYPNNGGYTVFGKVIDGMDVVDKIKAVPTHMQNGMGDVPVDPVVIESIRVRSQK